MEKDYAIFKRSAIAEYKTRLSQDEIEERAKLIREEVVREFGLTNSGNELMVRVYLERHLAEEAGIPPFEEWAMLLSPCLTLLLRLFVSIKDLEECRILAHEKAHE